MARVQLSLDDLGNRMILKAMLEAAGHTISLEAGDIVICDSAEKAETIAAESVVLICATVAGVPRAVQAMRKGVYGYILLPFQPGEADVMVRRALDGHAAPIETDLSPLDEIEIRHIESVLRHCKGNRVEAAKILGIGRNTLWRKLAARRTKLKNENGLPGKTTIDT